MIQETCPCGAAISAPAVEHRAVEDWRKEHSGHSAPAACHRVSDSGPALPDLLDALDQLVAELWDLNRRHTDAS